MRVEKSCNCVVFLLTEVQLYLLKDNLDNRFLRKCYTKIKLLINCRFIVQIEPPGLRNEQKNARKEQNLSGQFNKIRSTPLKFLTGMSGI